MFHQDIKSPGYLGLKNLVRLHLCWNQSIRRVACLNTPKVLQCDNGPEFKSEITELLEKNNLDIKRTKTK